MTLSALTYERIIAGLLVGHNQAEFDDVRKLSRTFLWPQARESRAPLEKFSLQMTPRWAHLMVVALLSVVGRLEATWLGLGASSASWRLRGGSTAEVNPETAEPAGAEKKEKKVVVVEREVVIIGSGPSGCTAAIYAGRALLNPLVVAGYTAGGQLMLTSDVENFPGYQKAIGGPELMGDLMGQASKFGAEFWRTDVKSIDLSSRPFRLELHNCTVLAKAVILSTGAEALWLGAEREEDFRGKGISTCATCDGYMFRDKPVVVVGGGDSAMEEANFLTRFASSVTVIHRRDTFRASKLMLKRATDNKKIRLLTHRRIARWHGKEGILAGVTVEDPRDGTVEDIACDGAFIAIGHRPNTAFLQGGIALDDNGYIKLRSNTMTSVEGVFACGDVVDHRYRQAITAAGMGCQAAMDAEKWLEEAASSHHHVEEASPPPL